MFKFLKFGRGSKSKVVIETQRQTFERLVGELNEAIAALPDMPAVTVNPVTNEISFALPDTFPDEALALPAPEPEPEGEVVEGAEAVEESTEAKVVEDKNATAA
ncbi:hypothetical protein EDD53_1842 [Pacificibacter maritimus]|uniref:Uncharacterized protein n=1 Tax=Pacificibacter maritimus TaxID=762213 RepID=A0A3N4U9M8_9RHOB|nr:hypothetical protein [Pacificibacter maritimus]RPE67433.1 hypothetical protein EDD53_1842 [Pacificibacter maritimus]